MNPLSSERGEQGMRTPPWLLKIIRKRFGRNFTLDAASTHHNRIVSRHYTEEEDGLAQPWRNGTFCNPPFTNFSDWIQKAYEEEVESVLIGPAGCSQKWFHEYAKRGLILVPDKRIAFCTSDGTQTKAARQDTTVYFQGGRFLGTGRRWNVETLAVREQIAKL